MIAREQQSPAVGRPGTLLRSARLRPLRFALTGGSAALVQLLVLRCLEALGTTALVANGAGFLVAAQVNFLLSQAFTWADRPTDAAGGEALAARWARFHAAIAGTALLNMLVFAAERVVVADLAAAALGTGTAGLLNFLLVDRLVFQGTGRAGGRAVHA